MDVNMSSTSSDKRLLVASIHLNVDHEVRVYQDQSIRLITPQRTLDLSLDPQDQARWWQYHYVQALIENGAQDTEVLAAIHAVRQLEAQTDNEEETVQLQRAWELAAQQMRTWCNEQGLDYDTLDETQLNAIADEAVAEWRRGK